MHSKVSHPKSAPVGAGHPAARLALSALALAAGLAATGGAQASSRTLQWYGGDWTNPPNLSLTLCTRQTDVA